MTDIPDDILTPALQNPDATRHVLIMTADKTEDLEFFYPYYRFIEEGFRVDVATPDGKGFKGKMGYKFPRTIKIAQAQAQDYDLLYIPGGKAPEELKKNIDAINLVKSFVALRKPISALCHGPQVLAAADVINGVSLAGWPEIENELRAAGGNFINREAVADGLFVTGRWPADLPFHMIRTLELLYHKEKADFEHAAARTEDSQGLTV